MKQHLKKFALMTALASVSILGCTKNESLPQPQNEALSTTKPTLQTASYNFPILPDSNCAVYNIILEGITDNGNGTYTWNYSISNPNPGNGLNGTIQDLSHFGITLGTCLVLDSVISAEYLDNGSSTWHQVPVTLGVDPGMQNCISPYNSVNMLKFGVGTTGTAKTFFRITISQNLLVDMNGVAYYKSGSNTTCGQMCFPGFGCPPPVEEPPVDSNGCSMSQGYWFAKPNLVWPSTVTIGGYTYTQQEGKDIWNTSNAGGKSSAKQAFCQVAAIKLSGSTVASTASVWPYVTTAETWLSTLPKLSATGAAGTLAVQPKSAANTNKAVTSAAGNIGDWINTYHCDTFGLSMTP